MTHHYTIVTARSYEISHEDLRGLGINGFELPDILADHSAIELSYLYSAAFLLDEEIVDARYEGVSL